MFESRISAGVTEKLPESENNGANVTAWSYDMEGHKEMRGNVLRICPQNNRTSVQGFHTMS